MAITVSSATYPSTLDSLALNMDIAYDSERRGLPVVLVLHGYSSTPGNTGIIERLAQKGTFAIQTYKRGFGGSAGVSDDGGRECHDFVDAVEYVKSNYAAYIDPSQVHVIGYSGGGGNVYGLLAKFPDYFNSANVFFGMSDYGHDPDYGWWNNGGQSYQSQMQTRIGGTPTTAPDRYLARAHHRAAVNNQQTRTQLFYDAGETTCPVSHMSQYLKHANQSPNIVSHLSDENTITSEGLQAWEAWGNPAYTGDLRWTMQRSTTFAGLVRKFDSLRTYSAGSSRLRAQFTFNTWGSAPDAAALIGFRADGGAFKNSAALLVINQTPYLRVDYDGTPLAADNRDIQVFSTQLSPTVTYQFVLELDSGVLTGTLLQYGAVIETQNLTLNPTKTIAAFTGFGVWNYPTAGSGQMVGGLGEVSVKAWARWTHGYPDSVPDLMNAENLFVPGIMSGQWQAPTLQKTGALFVAGYVHTKQFSCVLGQGNDHAGRLYYDVSGRADAPDTAQTFVIDPLTGGCDMTLTVRELYPLTAYRVEDGTDSVLISTSAAGTLVYSGTIAGLQRYRVYRD